MPVTVPLLWLYGPSGVGKSAVGWAVYRALAARAGSSVSAASAVSYVDIDQLGLCYPRPADDPAGLRLIARNLAAVCDVHVAAGARRIVVSGGGSEVPELLRAAGLSTVEPTLRRLRVAPAELTERIHRRGWAVHLADAAVAEAATLDASGGEALDTTGIPIDEVAAAVLAGWPPPAGSAGSAGPEAPSTVDHAAQPVDAPVLWLCGAPAVGTSAVGFAVFSRLLGAGEPTAYLDLAQLGFHAPATGPGNHRITAAAVAACWPAFRAAGADRLVLVGPAPETATRNGAEPDVTGPDRDAYRMPRCTLIRLHAGPETVRQRVFARGAGGGPPIPGDTLRGLPDHELAARAAESATIAARLERTGQGDVRIDTDDTPLDRVADAVLAAWQPEIR